MKTKTTIKPDPANKDRRRISIEYGADAPFEPRVSYEHDVAAARAATRFARRYGQTGDFRPPYRVNSAGVEDLRRSGLDLVDAARVVKARETDGRFTGWADLAERVRAIGANYADQKRRFVF